ncbi:ComEC/Rec2 family competence protein [Arthrobacter citreus]|uniref:hypothetical protein n=1 Tax=Arthrobacter citreus TaxID=1670 RepID=UPI0036DD8E49
MNHENPEGGEVRVYARVEEVETPRGTDGGIVRLDCIRADDPFIETVLEESNQKIRRRWRISFRVVEGRTEDSMNELGRVEAAIVPVRVKSPYRWLELNANSTWISLRVPAVALTAEDTPPVALEDFEEVPSHVAGKLDKIIDMTNWPRVPAPQLRATLEAIPPIAGTLVHDVGQGSANALFDSSDTAVVYFDTGRSGRGTTAPTNLDLCVCSAPLVILSHWDRDHWAAAEDGCQDLMRGKWVVPSQKIAGTHSTFAARILAEGGSIFVVKKSSKPKTLVGQHMYVRYGNGTDRNNSGLVLSVSINTRGGSRTLFFPGDALYSKCDHPPTTVDFLVASHHGADPKGSVNLPKPKNVQQSRLVYSFGRNRAYNHPSQYAITHHEAQGWDHTLWDSRNWHLQPTAGNVRATFTKADNQRQSIVYPPGALNLTNNHFSRVHGEFLLS